MIGMRGSMGLIAMAGLSLTACNKPIETSNTDIAEPINASEAAEVADIPEAPGEPDGKAFLQAAGFNEPLTVSVSPGGVADLEPTGIRHLYFDGTLSLGIASLLAKSGRIKPMPDSSKKTGWYMEAPGTNSAGDLTVPIGTRVMTGATNKRSWSEGATQFFAETITYIVKRSPDVAYAGAPELGPYSFRLVLVNDPAVGEWRLDDSKSERPKQDQQQIIKRLSDEGIAEIRTLMNKIQAARDEAAD